jgi:hypothetical protein
MKQKATEMLESRSLIATVYHTHYRRGLFKWIQDYEDASTERVLPGEKVWDDDGSKKCRFYQSIQNIGMVDTVFFKELVRNKSFIETCIFLRLHAVRHDQQNKDIVTRQVNATSQSSSSNKGIRLNRY